MPDRWGDCDSARQRIRLATGMATEAVVDTLLHELIHAMFAIQSLCDDSTEEEVASRLAPALLSVLKDDPAFFRRLTDVLSG